MPDIVIPDLAVEKELGRGGMGVVYRARQLSLDRPVAVKVIPTQGVSRDHVRRFVREVKLCAELSHPHVVRLFDAGETDTWMYLTMELIDGASMDRYVFQNGPLRDHRLLVAMEALSSALEAVHARAIVHRDIKPSNVMIDTTGTVKLMDFGLARPEGGTLMTAQNVLVGSPRYMAPETIVKGVYNTAADLYSLGVTFFEMATARNTFEAVTLKELFAHIVNEGVPRPSQFVPAIPRAIERIIVRLCDKEPERRFKTAQALCAAVRAVRESPEFAGLTWSTPRPEPGDLVWVASTPPPAHSASGQDGPGSGAGERMPSSSTPGSSSPFPPPAPPPVGSRPSGTRSLRFTGSISSPSSGTAPRWKSASPVALAIALPVIVVLVRAALHAPVPSSMPAQSRFAASGSAARAPAPSPSDAMITHLWEQFTGIEASLRKDDSWGPQVYTAASHATALMADWDAAQKTIARLLGRNRPLLAALSSLGDTLAAEYPDMERAPDGALLLNARVHGLHVMTQFRVEALVLMDSDFRRSREGTSALDVLGGVEVFVARLPESLFPTLQSYQSVLLDVLGGASLRANDLGFQLADVLWESKRIARILSWSRKQAAAQRRIERFSREYLAHLSALSGPWAPLIGRLARDCWEWGELRPGSKEMRTYIRDHRMMEDLTALSTTIPQAAGTVKSMEEEIHREQAN